MQIDSLAAADVFSQIGLGFGTGAFSRCPPVWNQLPDQVQGSFVTELAKAVAMTTMTTTALTTTTLAIIRSL